MNPQDEIRKKGDVLKKLNKGMTDRTDGGVLPWPVTECFTYVVPILPSGAIEPRVALSAGPAVPLPARN